MSICALVGSTEFNARHFQTQRFDCVIAVDGGYASLRAIDCEPDLVVGDFDSLGYVPEGGTVDVHPAEKDESDMELAIAHAIARGCDTLLFYGALAQRLDHTIANLQLMLGCARQGLRVAGIGRDFAVVSLDGEGASSIAFQAFDPSCLDAGRYGRFVSFFAFGGAAAGVCESGLKYGLAGARVPDDVSLGLSNEFTGKPASVSVVSGNALVTFSSDAWKHFSWR